MSSDLTSRTDFPQEWFREHPPADAPPEYAEVPPDMNYVLDVARQEDTPAALRELAAQIERQLGIESPVALVGEKQVIEKKNHDSGNRLNKKRVMSLLATYAIVQAGFSVGGAVLHADPGEANPITNNVVLEGPQNAANIWNKGVDFGHGVVNAIIQVKKVTELIG